MNTFTRHALLTGGTTLLSRLLGFVRDGGMAWLLGAGPVADALAAALRLPWAARRLLGEGALSLSLTAACAGRPHPAATAMAVARALLLPLLLGTALLWLCAPLLAELLAPGLATQDTAADMHTTLVPLLRLCVPYLPLAVLSACLMAGLHATSATPAALSNNPSASLSARTSTTRAFARAGLMPVIFNVVVIAAMVLASLCAATPFAAALAVGAGVVLGGVAQWLPGLPIWRAAQREPVPDSADTARIVRALPAGLLGAGMAQLAFLLGGMLASWLPEGHMAALFYAERLLEFPLGVLGAAVGMAAAPELRRNRDFAAPVLEWTLCLHLAAAAGLVAVAEPLVRCLFEHGAFDRRAVALTAANLQIYSLGLPAYALSRPLLTLCHGHPNHTRLPMYSALCGLGACLGAGLGVTFALCPALAPFLPPAAGPAVGATLALWVQTLILWVPLRRTANLRLSLRRVLWGCLAALAAYVAARFTLPLATSAPLSLALAVPAGILAWGGVFLGGKGKSF